MPAKKGGDIHHKYKSPERTSDDLCRAVKFIIHSRVFMFLFIFIYAPIRHRLLL